LTTGSFSIYDAGPGWDRPVPGTVVAVGPATWLVVTCNPQYRHCRNEVVDVSDGARRVLPGPVAAEPYYFSWPPAGVIAPDGSTAAVAETGRHGGLSVHLIDLRTGATRDLNVSLGVPGSDLPLGADSNDHSMAWSPDSRWLFAAAADGKLVAVRHAIATQSVAGHRVAPESDLPFAESGRRDTQRTTARTCSGTSSTTDRSARSSPRPVRTSPASSSRSATYAISRACRTPGVTRHSLWAPDVRSC